MYLLKFLAAMVVGVCVCRAIRAAFDPNEVNK